MAKRKKKRASGKPKRSYSHGAVMLVTGAALMLCSLSIMYGFLIRKSLAEHKVAEFRIEILNGTGVSGLAAKVATTLRQRGIDVFQVENADHFDYQETILIGRRKGGDLHELGRALGCSNVIEQVVEDSFVDATLILGADCQELKLGLEADSSLLR